MSNQPVQNASLGEDRSLLLVDDDRPFLNRLCRALEIRGFDVETAESVTEGLAKAQANTPAYAVVDMRLTDGNGLDVIELIRRKKPDSKVIVLTGYGNIATAGTMTHHRCMRSRFTTKANNFKQ